jgi:hypothetical protein
MKAFLKKVFPFILTVLGTIVAFLVGKSVVKTVSSVAKAQVKLPIHVNIPSNVREVSRAKNLNELVAEFTE